MQDADTGNRSSAGARADYGELSEANWATLGTATASRNASSTSGSESALSISGSEAGEAAQDGQLINGRYTVQRAIAHGGMGRVYEVVDSLHPDRSVALKIVPNVARNSANLALFKAEFLTMTKMNHPNVARVYDFGQVQGSDDFLITLELIDGKPLNRLAPETREWKRIVGQLVQVCRALSYIHSRRIIHFDLKPSNILVETSGNVKVLDFGIAGTKPSSHRGVMRGTPQYMAPEVLLTPVDADHRADLYSLGITIYELLVGRVPYASRDVLELCQRLMESDVRLAADVPCPAWLARVVEKLCARDPADRFRSANAVLQEINAAGGFDYELETEETRQSYITTPRFSGRAAEHERLAGFVSERLDGRGDRPLLMLSGLSGIGKSRLMKEVRHVVQLQRRAFLESNCYERSLIEYGPIADILYQLVPLVEAMGGFDVVQTALPELAKVAPRLALGRGYEAGLTTVEGERARLLESIATFIVEAARLVPFALYVNDLQWSDPGPAQVLAYIAKRIADEQALGNSVRCAIIGSYRSDEVHGRALEELLAVLRRQSLSLELVLKPLSSADVGEVVRSMLGVDEVPHEFLERVAAETKGNPFFVQEVMRVLFENGSVFLQEGKWTTKGEIGALQIPASMTDVFRRRFDMLMREAQDAVRVLAVHGRPMLLDYLAALLGGIEPVLAVLGELEDKMIVVKQVGRAVAYNIAHDRMRETIYGDLDESERPGWHARIGEKLEALSADVAESEKPLDELARHFWAAGAVAKARDYGVRAGRRALAQHSNEQAFQLLSRVVDESQARGGEDPTILARLQEDLGVGCMRTGRLALAEQHFARALEHTSGALGQARLHYYASLLHSTVGQHQLAWDKVQDALALVDARMPDMRALQFLGALYHWASTVVRIRTGWGVGRVAGEERLRAQAISGMLNAAFYSAYLTGDYLKMAACSFRHFENALLLGNTPEAAKDIALHFFWVATTFGATKTVKRLGERAIAQTEQLGDLEAVTFCRTLTGFTLDYTGNTRRGQQLLRESLPNIVRYSMARDSGMFIGAACVSITHRGCAREAVERIHQYLPTAQRMGAHYYVSNMLGALYSQYTLLGLRDKALAYREEQRAIASAMPNSRFVQAFLHSHAIFALYEEDRFDDELERSIEQFLTLGFNHYLSRLGYLMVAYVRLEQLLRTREPRARRRARKALAQALWTATYGPPLRCILSPLHRCHVYTIRAAIARSDGHFRRALRLLDQAEKNANDSDSPWGLWAVHQERARVAADCNDPTRARQEARRALDIATREGWVTRANRLRKEFDPEG